MPTNWLLDVEPAPALLVLPDADSLDEAHAAIEMWEAYSRKTLDLTQRLAVEIMMATRGDRWAAATTGREMPRQNGKGDEIEVVEFWGLVQRGEAILHTVHDAVLLTTQAQQRMLSLFDTDLGARKKRVHVGTGQQMIELKNGGVIWYRTRSGGGGRGVDDVDRLVVDEAQHATEEHLAAVSPTLLANDNPQLNAMGTSALDGKSDWWWTIRRRSLIEDPGSFGYIGHTAERVRIEDGRIKQDPVDFGDRDLWRAANPAVTRRPEIMDFLEEQFLRMSPKSFGEEHLGVWAPPPQDGETEIDPNRWTELAGKEPAPPSPIALSVEVAEGQRSDLAWCSIGLAGKRHDGARHVEITKSERGTAWLVPEMIRLRRVHGNVLSAVAIYGSGPAGALIADLEAEKFEVMNLSPGDLGKATQMTFNGIADGSIRHSNQPVLNISVGAAKTRKLGDTRVWDLSGKTDIAPLRAVSVALFALASAPVPVETYVPRRIH